MQLTTQIINNYITAYGWFAEPVQWGWRISSPNDTRAYIITQNKKWCNARKHKWYYMSDWRSWFTEVALGVHVTACSAHPGHIYMLRHTIIATGEKKYKIGKAADLRSRLREYERDAAIANCDVELLYSRKVPDRHTAERELIALVAQLAETSVVQLVTAEWFRGPEDIPQLATWFEQE